MKVKGKREHQGDATRKSLLAAARRHFGESGYVETSLDEVVAEAGVTKGALYHHFRGKDDLFRAVYEQVQLEVSDAAVAEFLGPDPWISLEQGCSLWVAAHLDPAVQRITLQDARAVLGFAESRAIENRYAAVALRGSLRKAMVAGVLKPTPLRPLSLLLMGALSEGCWYIADADDQAAARAEVDALVVQLLSGFKVTPGG